MGETKDPRGLYRPWFVGFLVVTIVCLLTWVVISDGRRMVPRDSLTYLSAAENRVSPRSTDCPDDGAETSATHRRHIGRAAKATTIDSIQVGCLTAYRLGVLTKRRGYLVRREHNTQIA